MPSYSALTSLTNPFKEQILCAVKKDEVMMMQLRWMNDFDFQKIIGGYDMILTVRLENCSRLTPAFFIPCEYTYTTLQLRKDTLST